MRSFIHRYGGGWPVLQDPDQATAISYGVYGVPETFFIDRRGIVRYKSTGPVPWDVLNTQIRKLIRSPA
jgi:cytochrome c biogenesis protein CcmG/thiol:disulfide interchange protein DsbE